MIVLLVNLKIDGKMIIINIYGCFTCTGVSLSNSVFCFVYLLTAIYSDRSFVIF